MTTQDVLREQAGSVVSISRPDAQGLCTFAVLTPPLQRPTNFYKVTYKDVAALQDNEPITITTKRGRAKDGGDPNDNLRGYWWDFVGVRAGHSAATAQAPQAPSTAQAPSARPAQPAAQAGASASVTTGSMAALPPLVLPQQRRFTIAYGRTLNKGNFESERIDLTREFDEGVDPIAAFEQVRHQVLAMSELPLPTDEPAADKHDGTAKVVESGFEGIFGNGAKA